MERIIGRAFCAESEECGCCLAGEQPAVDAVASGSLEVADGNEDQGVERVAEIAGSECDEEIDR